MGSCKRFHPVAVGLVAFFFGAVACADTLYVGPGQTYSTIQSAMDASVDEDIILLADGTYTGTGNVNLDFKGKAITLKSENGPNACIIDCQNIEGRRGFYFHTAEDSSSVVDGLTIKRGRVNDYGAGIYCHGASPTIVNCVISGNNVFASWGSHGYGAGIYCSSACDLTLDHCRILGNTVIGGTWEFHSAKNGYGGGICFNADGTLTIRDTVISNNKAYGGEQEGFSASNGSGYGGGIYTQSGTTILSNCIVSGNLASFQGGGNDFASGECYGGGIYGSGMTISHSLIYKNTVKADDAIWSHGGGICGSNLTITNCTITKNLCLAYNSSYLGLGCQLYDQGSTTVSNSVIPQELDEPGPGYDWTGEIEGNPTIRYSNVPFNYPGTGNITEDPLFADPATDDYHLKSQAGRWDPVAQAWVMDTETSPCIDAGDPAADYSAEPENNGNRINQGCYGGTVFASKSPEEDLYVPTSAYPTIQAAVDVALPNQTIFLANGRYQGPGNRGVTINKSLTIRGVGGPKQCIIDCGGATRAFTVQIDNEDVVVVFDGLTLENGGGVSEGGAILLNILDTPMEPASGTERGTARLTNCIVNNNRAGDGIADDGSSSLGGGICVVGPWNLEIRDCIIQGNRALGATGQSGYDGSPGGDAYGGGIYFENNGIFSESHTLMVLTRSILQGNTAEGGKGGKYSDVAGAPGGKAIGGGICGRGSNFLVYLKNCHIIDNNARGGCEPAFDFERMGWICDPYGPAHGAGIGQCSGEISNCTMMNNRATKFDGDSYDYDAIYHFTGSIINSILQDSSFGESGVEINYSWTSQPVAGVGNITEDPLYANPATDDYHLKSQAGRWDPVAQEWVKDTETSPCIDAGDPASDWTEELWPHGKRINMGAYGGTPQASMSPYSAGNIADLNHDHKVDLADWSLWADDWMIDQILLAADLDRDNDVDIDDLAIFAAQWCWIEP